MSKKFAAIISTLTYSAMAVSVFALGPSPSGLEAPASAINPNIDPTTVPQLAVNLLFILAGTLAVIYLIFGGIKWITSRGDKVGVESARKHIVAAMVGLIIVAGSFFAINTLFTILGAANPLKSAIPTLPSPS